MMALLKGAKFLAEAGEGAVGALPGLNVCLRSHGVFNEEGELGGSVGD